MLSYKVKKAVRHLVDPYKDVTCLQARRLLSHDKCFLERLDCFRVDIKVVRIFNVSTYELLQILEVIMIGSWLDTISNSLPE